MSQTVIATTTLASYGSEQERVRVECSLKTVEAALNYDYRLVTVDADSPTVYYNAIKSLGAIIYAQNEPGMGKARRQALRRALAVSSERSAIVWMEPEKYPLVPLLGEAAADVTDHGYDLVMLRRKSLASYPPEQAMAYQLIALATKYLTGIDCDFGWGPTVLSKRAVQYYLDYQGEYGDRWDSIHIPKLRIIRDGLPWKVVEVDYRHPPEQTAAETGWPLFRKRIQQVDSLTSAIEQEVERLGMKI